MQPLARLFKLVLNVHCTLMKDEMFWANCSFENRVVSFNVKKYTILQILSHSWICLFGTGIKARLLTKYTFVKDYFYNI